MTLRSPAFLFGIALAALTLAGCDRPPEAPAPAAPGITMGTQVDDAVVTSGIKSALVADPVVKGFDLQVETRKGVVQLSGFVDSQAQIDRAMAVARGVTGVSAVENSVSLKGAPSTAGTMLDDTAVTGRVKAALLADPDIKSFDISVLTFKGEVQLTGFVNSQAQIDQATRIAAAAEGARSVKNELLIKQ
ncbi:transport-associated protein [Hydrogenophaga taeniospiralis CCUG 15921]|uniref:Osmotically-inducible protein Y n=1 Tax=Hydrogenophaga taeniospiralis CCUG 15921 TaxID=1281780 RepID=A0A9X4NNZ5_9BURK|nr:BON domain-containing protein [Hydrogenophaga taeniospiralis]MDG5974905.1 transport-associated protein [Hydrogenophaga taeniospiralis CCUG 15921]